MKFKTQTLNQVYKLEDSSLNKTTQKDIPALNIKSDTENVRLFDIKSNQEIIEDAKE